MGFLFLEASSTYLLYSWINVFMVIQIEASIPSFFGNEVPFFGGYYFLHHYPNSQILYQLKTLPDKYLAVCCRSWFSFYNRIVGCDHVSRSVFDEKFHQIAKTNFTWMVIKNTLLCILKCVTNKQKPQKKLQMHIFIWWRGEEEWESKETLLF